MRKNTRLVIDAWRNSKPLKQCQSIWTDGEAIYSYATCLVVTEEDAPLILNMTKYSRTTTIHQNSLLVWFAKLGEQVIVMGDFPRGVTPEQILRTWKEFEKI